MESLIINSKDINETNNFNLSSSFHIEKRKQEIKEVLKTIPHVENCSSVSYNGSGSIPNQFIIKGKDFVLFQSYNSPIVMKKNGKVYIFRNWDYSTTTGKYRNDFLGETKKETLQKLKSGKYIAVDFEIIYNDNKKRI